MIYYLISSLKEAKTDAFTAFVISFPSSWLNDHSSVISLD